MSNEHTKKQTSKETNSPEEGPIVRDSKQISQHKSLENNISLRESFGRKLLLFSDLINDNLIACRYGAFASITLLTAYGLSKTPIFFRYRKVSEIPASCFMKRQTVHGRIVHVVENNILSTYINLSYYEDELCHKMKLMMK